MCACAVGDGGDGGGMGSRVKCEMLMWDVGFRKLCSIIEVLTCICLSFRFECSWYC